MDEAKRRFCVFDDRLRNFSEGAMEHSTVAIAHPKAGAPDELDGIRSGILLQVGPSRFLITAGHDIAQFLHEGRPLVLTMPGRTCRPIELRYEQFQITNETEVDLAITKLHESTVGYIEGQYRYVQLADLMSKYDPRHDEVTAFYVLAGFPSAHLLPDHNGIPCAENWKYRTYKYLGDCLNVENYDPNIHLVVAYERDSTSPDGKIIQPPGMSGCGLWYVGNPFSDTIVTVDEVKLVAIQGAWSETFEYAKCTWINSVVAIIGDYFPETRPALRAHGMSQ